MGFLYFVAALLAVFFVWGLFWPRSQWRVLASWLRRNPDASEPGPTSYAVQRIISGLGIATFLTVGGFIVSELIRSLPSPEPQPNSVQRMWGLAPVPQIVNRIVTAAPAASDSLVEEKVHGYQVIDNVRHLPRYLAYLNYYDAPGPSDEYIGEAPPRGYGALDTADLIINLRPKSQCVPRQVIVIETEDAVQIGVYSGLATIVGEFDDADAPDNSFCTGGSLVGPSLLVPLTLKEELGDREVQHLDGTPIRAVEWITD